MSRLIRSEFYRMTKNTGFYIFWGVILFTYAITLIYKSEGGVSLGAPMTTVESLKMDINMVARNFTYYFLMIITVFSIIAKEFSEGTVKNTISSAISKRAFYLSKFVFTFAYSLLAFFASNVVFYLLNAVINGKKYTSSFGDFIKAVCIQLPVMAAIVSLFIFLAFLFRKGAAFNAVTIIGPVAYTSVSLVLYGISSTKEIAEKGLLKYEVSMMLYQLATGCTDSYKTVCMSISAVVIGLSFVLGYLCFVKRELD